MAYHVEFVAKDRGTCGTTIWACSVLVSSSGVPEGIVKMGGYDVDGVLGSNPEKLELVGGRLVCQVWGWLVHITFVLKMPVTRHVGPCSSSWVTQREVKVFAPLIRVLGRKVILVQLLFVVGFGQRHVVGHG